MLATIRFILTPIAAITGFYAAMAGGILAYSVAEMFYPPESFISGACTAPSWPIVEKTLFIMFSGIAAVLCVTFASIMAPCKKQATRWIAYFAGTIIALTMAVIGDAWLEFTSAMIAGLITIRLLPQPRTSTPMQPNQPLE